MCINYSYMEIALCFFGNCRGETSWVVKLFLDALNLVVKTYGKAYGLGTGVQTIPIAHALFSVYFHIFTFALLD